jgi:hypothetical protein
MMTPGMRMVAEVIASAFASGFPWGKSNARKRVYCASPDLKGGQIISAFAVFLEKQSEVGRRALRRSAGGDTQQGAPMLALMATKRHSISMFSTESEPRRIGFALGPARLPEFAFELWTDPRLLRPTIPSACPQ